MNSLGMNSLGMNSLGMNSLGMNSLGMNSLGMNRLRRRAERPQRRLLAIKRSEGAGARTLDLRIKSPLLYQLSYTLGKMTVQITSL